VHSRSMDSRKTLRSVVTVSCRRLAGSWAIVGGCASRRSPEREHSIDLDAKLSSVSPVAVERDHLFP